MIYKKSRYERLVDNHQCTSCGEPLPEGYKLKTCQKCRKYSNAYLREYHKGKCTRCACDLPPDYEYKTCKSCRFKMAQEREKKKESNNG